MSDSGSHGRRALAGTGSGEPYRDTPQGDRRLERLQPDADRDGEQEDSEEQTDPGADDADLFRQSNGGPNEYSGAGQRRFVGAAALCLP